MYPPPSSAEATLHLQIARHLHHHLAPAITGEAGEVVDDGLSADLLNRFITGERLAIAERAAAAPVDADDFIRWFESLQINGPGQGDPLFPWLATTATWEEIRWFLSQELAGEAGFDDLVALTQVKMPARAKMEMAKNLWDEFGRGNGLAAHGALLTRMADDLEIVSNAEGVIWEALALSNLMAGLATNRQYAYQSVGALGVIEMTAPGRVSLVNAGLRRLGVPSATRRYFELHATLDIQHSKAWNMEVLRSLVESDPRIAPLIAEGALMRLEAGRRCFAAYDAHFALAACGNGSP